MNTSQFSFNSDDNNGHVDAPFWSVTRYTGCI